jgi:sugar phosphate isomerase/epimerase
MDHVEAVEAAAEFGFDFVEVMLDGAGHRERIDTDRVAAAFDDAGLDALVHLPFGGLDPGSPFPAVREGSVSELTAHLDAAAAFGAEKAVLHPTTNAWSPAHDDEDLRANAVESVRALRTAAADRGIELCPENIPRSIFRTHDMGRLFEATEVPMTLDTGHARVDGRDSAGIAAFVGDHADRIGHVHLNDTRVASDEHVPFGSGTIDFERIFGAFPDGWTGTLSLEVFTLDYGYIETSGRRLGELLER